MADFFTILVTVVGILMSLGYFPQAFKIIKTRSAKNISLITYLIFAIGTYVWLIYGFIIKELPIIISFVIGSIGSTLVLFLILKYK